jgi:type VII secretion protein EccE
MSRSVPLPGSGRLTLALLAIVPAVMAYPFRTPREQWVLGIAVAVVILLFGWWGGLHFTTILRRRLAMMRRPSDETASPALATALLRLGPPTGDEGVLPLPLIEGYLNCYGIRADTVRITSRITGSDACQTWIALTVSAAENLDALSARSSAIPLHETTRVAVRRLADHLREVGWEATISEPDVVPRLLDSADRESWRAVQAGSGFLAAYRVSVDDGLPGTLDAVLSQKARETWVALEIAEGTVAVGCALLTDEQPSGAAPLPGLTAQRGNQRPALAALDLLSTERLDGHTVVSDRLLDGLDWPCPVAGAHRAPLAETRT